MNSSPSQSTRDSSPFSSSRSSISDTSSSSSTIDNDHTAPTTPATSIHGSPPPTKPSSPLATASLKGALLARLTPINTSQIIRCSACNDPIPPSQSQSHSTPLPCTHRSCRECTSLSAKFALKKASLGSPFHPATCLACPSPCCSPHSFTPSHRDEEKHHEPGRIPLAMIGQSLTPAEFLAYRMRLHEAALPETERLYCYAEDCRVYITKKTGRSGTCSRCFRRTCRVCRGPSHRASVACCSSSFSEREKGKKGVGMGLTR
ncbi:hypothetical protein QBC47DRAFT_133995, partial [Echria macrotheca]